MPNSLRTLAQKIRDLPKQDTLRQKKIQLTGIANSVEASVAEVRDAKQRVVALRAVLEQPDLLDGPFASNLSNVARRAQSLSRLVRAAETPTAAQVSGQLQPVTEGARALKQAVEDQWASICREEIEKAQAFVALARMYDQAARGSIQAALDRFRSFVVAAPISAEQMTEYRESLRHLIAARNSLRIEGPVAEFLLAAANGNGDPRGLEDSSVRQFLDQHPILWTKLRVSLA